MKLARDNHYVPIWYQKRFLSPEADSFYYLNLEPDQKTLPDGRRVTLNAVNWPFSPRKCFYQTDLYTTRFFGFMNDEIERYLFGKIDTEGVKAVSAMAEQDLSQLHQYFQIFFGYMDVQKLRTPKGLDWIKSKFPQLTHSELLIEMQRVGKLHATLWFECVKEIVSAQDSSVKFLVSDHPVTIYNRACPPDSDECIYPNDPRLEMKASQTIYPLDKDRCLILTNLDYANNPQLIDPKARRPNANPCRDTMVRWDNTICQRQLSEQDVWNINLIIKKRAKKFIAAENKEWLCPEKHADSDWAKLGDSFVPPPDEVLHFGGEIYAAYDDGHHSFHDAYGRTEIVPDFLKKSPVSGKVGPNDLCNCGSGRKYKKCCRDLPESDRPDCSVLSIRERNIRFSYAIADILKLDGDVEWMEVRRNLTDSQIADIHGAFACLWPAGTDLMALLPRPNPNIQRALYCGLLDPQHTPRNIFGFGMSADEILLQNPFLNANVVSDEFNPVKKPSLYRQETLKNVLFFMSMMPMLECGLVNILPDPLMFYPALREQVYSEAEQRKDEVIVDEKVVHEMGFKLFKHSLLTMSDSQIVEFIKNSDPEFSDETVAEYLAYMVSEREKDPVIALGTGFEGGQMSVSHLSPNLEMSLFIAQATGAYIYTDNPHRWSEFNKYLEPPRDNSPLRTVMDIFQELETELVYLFDPRTYMLAKQRDDLHAVKDICKKLVVLSQSGRPISKEDASRLGDEIRIAQTTMERGVKKFVTKFSDKKYADKRCLPPVSAKAKLSCLLSPHGHKSHAVYRFLLANAGHDRYLKSAPLCIFLEHESVENRVV